MLEMHWWTTREFRWWIEEIFFFIISVIGIFRNGLKQERIVECNEFQIVHSMFPESISVYLDHDWLVVNYEYNSMIWKDWLFVHLISMNETITTTRKTFVRILVVLDRVSPAEDWLEHHWPCWHNVSQHRYLNYCVQTVRVHNEENFEQLDHEQMNDMKPRSRHRLLLDERSKREWRQTSVQIKQTQSSMREARILQDRHVEATAWWSYSVPSNAVAGNRHLVHENSLQ